MTGKDYWAIDSTMEQGLANPFFEKTIEVASKDSVKYKAQLIGSYKYFVVYNISIKKDKAKALEFCDKILTIDPTDAETLSNKDVISKMSMKSSKAAPPKPPSDQKKIKIKEKIK